MSAPAALLLQQIRWTKLPEPESEFPFAKAIGRRWRFDFAWPSHKVAVEVQGGVFVGGRHARGSGITGDCEKFSVAAGLGWRVLPVTPAQVKSGDALQWIERAVGFTGEGQ